MMHRSARRLAAPITLAALLMTTAAQAQLTDPAPQETPADVNGQAVKTEDWGSVPEAPTTEKTAAADYLEVAITPLEHNEYSSKKYQAYTLRFNNKQPVHVELLQVDVVNAVHEAEAAAEKQKAKQRGLKTAGFLLKGASLVPGLALSGGLAGGAGLALAGTQNALATAGNAVSYLGTAEGGVAGQGRYIQRAGNVIIGPGQDVTFQALVPKGVQPQVKLIFKDLQSNRIFDLNR